MNSTDLTPVLPALLLLALIVRSAQPARTSDRLRLAPRRASTASPAFSALALAPQPAQEMCRACCADDAVVLALFTGAVTGLSLAVELPLCSTCLTASDGTATTRPLPVSRPIFRPMSAQHRNHPTRDAA